MQKKSKQIWFFLKKFDLCTYIVLKLLNRFKIYRFDFSIFFVFSFFFLFPRFVSPLYFLVVVPRYSTPGWRVQVLELVFPVTRARALAKKGARGLGPSRVRVQVLGPDAVGSKSSSQTLSGRSPRASRSYYFSLFFSFVFIVFMRFLYVFIFFSLLIIVFFFYFWCFFSSIVATMSTQI